MCGLPGKCGKCENVEKVENVENVALRGDKVNGEWSMVNK
jgi:hypothetical protein